MASTVTWRLVAGVRHAFRDNGKVALCKATPVDGPSSTVAVCRRCWTIAQGMR